MLLQGRFDIIDTVLLLLRRGDPIGCFSHSTHDIFHEMFMPKYSRKICVFGGKN